MAPSEPDHRRRSITAQPEIRPLAPSAAGDETTIAVLTELINEVYAAAEKGLWTGGSRTTSEEVAGLVRAGQIAVARLDGRLAGCVRVHRLDDDTSEFGMLAADLRYRGLGVGRELVRFAEQRGRDDGHRTMRLELLVPREWSHPSKEFLAGWYRRIGYKVVRTGTIEEAHPHLAPLLAAPCDVLIHEKDLRAQ